MAMERRVILPRDPASVRLARTFARDAVEQWSAPVDVETVELATSEVVTNALGHGESDLALTLRLDDDALRVEVLTPAEPAVDVPSCAASDPMAHRAGAWAWSRRSPTGRASRRSPTTGRAAGSPRPRPETRQRLLVWASVTSPPNGP